MPMKPPQHRPAQHRPAAPRSNQFADRAFDAQRGTPAERGYDHVWKKLRKIVIAEEPLCRHCLAEGHLTPGQHVDHIIPISVDPALRLVRYNLQHLCVAHHNKKTAMERKAP